jgi:hypothetical protein
MRLSHLSFQPCPPLLLLLQSQLQLLHLLGEEGGLLFCCLTVLVEEGRVESACDLAAGD